jgi:hypothetical protein
MNFALRIVAVLAAAGPLLAAAGCGRSGGMNLQVPITVSLGVSPVVVSQDGTPVPVQILIDSTSETAIVTLNDMPAGAQAKYAASDTNPSGTLTFTAGSATPTGTYMPTLTVNSAGQTVSTKFTLNITAEKKSEALQPPAAGYQPSTYANTSGATMEASDSIMNLGVSSPNLPQVIFSFGTAPE